MRNLFSTEKPGDANTTSLFALLNNLRFNASHYNSITDAWVHIFGDNFHFGYFSSSEFDLPDATNALIDEMAALANFNNHSRVLDVGCGIGNPAFYLHNKFLCSITGISTSQKGIEKAQKESEKHGYSEKVKFQLADGLDNGFPDDSFDIVWVMESSHLMDNKNKLIEECYRVLKPGGVLLLCDLVLKRPYSITKRLELFTQLRSEYLIGTLGIIKAFGNVKMETIEFYREAMLSSGFTQIHTIDISKETKRTFREWKANIITNKDKILETLSHKQIDYFNKASDLGEYMFDKRISGYGIFRAIKPLPSAL